MEGELLLAGARSGVPDDGRPVDPRAEDVVPGLVPLQSKDRPLVLTKSLLLLAVGVPDSEIVDNKLRFIIKN